MCSLSDETQTAMQPIVNGVGTRYHFGSIGIVSEGVAAMPVTLARSRYPSTAVVALVALLAGSAVSAAPTAVDEIVKTFKAAPTPAPAPASDDEDSMPVGKERAFDFLGGSKSRQRTVAPATTMASVQPARASRPAATRAPRAARASLDMRLEFAMGSAELSDAAKAEARQFAAALQTPDLSPMRFTVEGHTDAVGDRTYNLELSRRRAQAVVDFMMSQGVDSSRLQPQGFGFDKPRFGSAANPRNRRVEFARIG